METGRNLHKWENLFPAEFFEEQKKAPVVYLACGCMEEHGLHIALGTDFLPVYELCLQTADKAGGIVYPPVPFVPAYAPAKNRKELKEGGFELYPPSVFFSIELCRDIYLEIFERFSQLGFKLCVAVGGHGPGITALNKIRESLGGKLDGMRIITPHWVQELVKSEKFKKFSDEHPGALAHGGLIETALVNGYRADWCQLEKVELARNSSFKTQLEQLCRAEEKNGINYLADIRNHADAELGRGIIRYLVDSFTSLVKTELGQNG